MTTTQRRVARKRHQCSSCLGRILVGEVYLVHTLFPGNDIRYNKVPERCAECADCATRYGRGDILGGVA